MRTRDVILDTLHFVGLWYDIESRVRPAKKRWRFAHYIETPSERADGQWFEALYFRDEERTKFGKLEFIGELERRDFRSIATKIEKDERYRKRLLSDDAELPRLWRRR